MITRFESVSEIPHPSYCSQKSVEHIPNLSEAATEDLLEGTGQYLRDGRAS
jgi:hypothetical protein